MLVGIRPERISYEGVVVCYGDIPLSSARPSKGDLVFEFMFFSFGRTKEKKALARSSFHFWDKCCPRHHKLVYQVHDDVSNGFQFVIPIFNHNITRSTYFWNQSEKVKSIKNHNQRQRNP